jgi:hypothetical protein
MDPANPVLAKFTLPRKDDPAMDPRDALDQLETIRLLMERSALYRRALGPMCLAIGSLGGAAALAAYYLGIEGSTAFALWWLSTAAVALALAFFIARRQAIGAGEPFWSPPTRRVAAAVLPPLAATPPSARAASPPPASCARSSASGSRPVATA